MAVNKKLKRLSKIAREFNVGISTLVDFLKKKGKEIDSDPNSQISIESYDILRAEYDREKNMKQESEKLSKKSKEKRKTITIEDKPSEEKEEEEKEEEVIIIKDTSGVKERKSLEEELLNPLEEIRKRAPKIIDKIDLDAINKPAASKKNENIITEEVKKTVDSVEKEKSEIETEVKTEEATAKTKTPEVKDEKKKTQKPQVKKVMPEEKTAGQNQAKNENKLETKKAVDKKESSEKEDNIKVVGKINLDKISPTKKKASNNKKEKEVKTGKEVKPQRNADEQKPKKRRERKPKKDGVKPNLKETKKVENSQENTPQPKKEEPKKEEPKKEEAEIFKTEVKKLTGPTVIGKINLPEPKKKPVASSSDKKGKKKRRRRINKDKVTPQTPASTGPKVKKVLIKAGANTDKNKQQDNRQRPQQDRRKLRPTKKVNKKIVKKEVSEEDVQKQIKETLARLTAPKHKTSGSRHRKQKREQVQKKQQKELEQQKKESKTLKVTEFVSVNELATMMNVTVTNVISACMSMGLFVSINQRLDAETLALVAEEFGYKVEFVSIEVQEAIKQDDDDENELATRSPIVTVMGHVDHGKTSLLDHIRSANVIAGEAGGITQHIGAYNVQLKNGKTITFLDTPGHEAFTAMRARGAQVTDIAIIVVSADDSVMPQTVEAINHAQAAGVPIVFAINKIDKPGANPEKIKEQLANMNYLVEEWGGKYQSQDISAKQGLKVDELLESVLLEAEMLDLKANPTKKARGSIIESSLDKGRGYVATVLVQNGTLKVGDIVLAGCYTGRVKAMYNERNQPVEEAGPASPVLILGLNGAPQAGDNFNVMENDKEAREIANKREQLQREQGLRTQKYITLDEIGRRIAIGNFQELNIIIKGDVDGSIEALADSLIKLSTEEIQVNIIHKAVGQISESDIMLAAASDAIMLGFQVRPSMGARKLAEKEGIDIRLYSIIYDAINEIKDAMEGMLSPEIKEEITATIEIREVFKISKVGTIAGCMVKEGKVNRNSKIRIIRDGIVVYTGELGSLRRHKDDVKEVASGYECGLNVEKFNDIKIGDIIEAYQEVEVKKTI